MRLLLASLALTLSVASTAATCTDTAFVDSMAEATWVNLDVSPAQGTRGVRDALRQAQSQHPSRPVRIRLAPGSYADNLGSEIYAQRLLEEGSISQEEVDKIVQAFQARLDSELEVSQSYKPNKADWLEGAWSGLEIASGDERRCLVRRELFLEPTHRALHRLALGLHPFDGRRQLLGRHRQQFLGGREGVAPCVETPPYSAAAEELHAGPAAEPLPARNGHDADRAE